MASPDRILDPKRSHKTKRRQNKEDDIYEFLPQELQHKDNGETPERLGDEWDELEDELTKKRKKRLVSKYSEKRFIP